MEQTKVHLCATTVAGVAGIAPEEESYLDTFLRDPENRKVFDEEMAKAEEAAALCSTCDGEGSLYD